MFDLAAGVLLGTRAVIQDVFGVPVALVDLEQDALVLPVAGGVSKCVGVTTPRAAK